MASSHRIPQVYSVPEAILDASSRLAGGGEEGPTGAPPPKKRAFRTIRKEVTLRAPGPGAAGVGGPGLGAWWAVLAPSARADGAWHDLSLLVSIPEQNQRSPNAAFSETESDDDDETLGSDGGASDDDEGPGPAGALLFSPSAAPL